MKSRAPHLVLRLAAGLAIACLATLLGCRAKPDPSALRPRVMSESTTIPEHEFDPSHTHVVYPDDTVAEAWMNARRDTQLAGAESLDAFHDFEFHDIVRDTGINFYSRVVDDAAKAWKPAHYDHGNGLAVADVDGDGLLDLYFLTQLGSNQLWRNLGDNRFEEITADSGLGMTDLVSVAASFADIDNDGDPDLYVTTVRGGNRLFENVGDGQYEDVTEASGTSYTGHSSSAEFFDYDRDGLVDLLLVNVGVYTSERLLTAVNDATTEFLEPGSFNYYEAYEDAFEGHLAPERSERSLLYRNLGNNRFEEVSEAMGLVDDGWSGDATAADFNRDGWPDLYLLNMQGPDKYFENDGGERFVDKTAKLFPRTSWGAMGVKSFDFDQDGRLDLYVTDMHTDMAGRVQPTEELEGEKNVKKQTPEYLLGEWSEFVFGNAFYRQLEDGSFEEVSDAIGAENYWPWGLSVGDLNADGFLDAFLTSSMNYPFRYAVNSVFLNANGERFHSAEFTLGVEPRAGGSYWPAFALDLREQPEHFMAEKIDKHLPDVEPGPVVVWGALGSRGSAILDLEGDGDLDIVTNEHNSPPMVLVSDLSERQPGLRFLKVALVGSQSNRDGLGAHVRVVTDGRTYTQVYDGQSGYLSQSRMPLYFGIPSGEKLVRLEVDWPSGARTVHESEELELNGLAVLREPAGELSSD